MSRLKDFKRNVVCLMGAQQPLTMVELFKDDFANIWAFYSDGQYKFVKCSDVAKFLGYWGFSLTGGLLNDATKLNGVSVFIREVKGRSVPVIRISQLKKWLQNIINLTLLSGDYSVLDKQKTAREKAEEILKWWDSFFPFINYSVSPVPPNKAKLQIKDCLWIELDATYLDKFANRDGVALKIFRNSRSGDYYFQPYNLAGIFCYEYKGLEDNSIFADSLFQKAQIVISEQQFERRKMALLPLRIFAGCFG